MPCQRNFKGTPKECKACQAASARDPGDREACGPYSRDQRVAPHTPRWPTSSTSIIRRHGVAAGPATRRRGDRQDLRRYRYGPGMRRLPYDAVVGRGGVHPPRRHRELRSCHNGVQATGVRQPHPKRALACEACHSPTDARRPRRAINHPAVAALSCASCHRPRRLSRHEAEHGHSAARLTSAGSTGQEVAPRTGDCGQCHEYRHVRRQCGQASNHIPTSPPCAQCHATAGNYALYSVTGPTRGSPTVSLPWPDRRDNVSNITITTTPENRIPMRALDCRRAMCPVHTTPGKICPPTRLPAPVGVAAYLVHAPRASRRPSPTSRS